MIRGWLALLLRVVCVVSITFNLVVISLVALWYAERAKPSAVDSRQMHRVIQEKSWNSAGEWRVVRHDASAMIVEYRLPYFDFYRYRLPAKEFRMSKEAQMRPTPFALSYGGCEVMRRIQETNTFVCMPFRDLRRD